MKDYDSDKTMGGGPEQPAPHYAVGGSTSCGGDYDDDLQLVASTVVLRESSDSDDRDVEAIEFFPSSSPNFEEEGRCEASSSSSSSSALGKKTGGWVRRGDVRLLLALLAVTCLLVGAAVGVALAVANGGGGGGESSSSSSSSEQENLALGGDREPPVPKQHAGGEAEGRYVSNDVTGSPTASVPPTPSPFSSSSIVGGGGLPSSSSSSSSARPASSSWGTMHPDDGTCSDLAFSPDDSPVLEMEEDCSYVRVGTANLSAPLISPDGAGQKLSGGTGAIDGGVAVVVSYDSTGMAGAVWIAENGAAGAAWEQAYVVSPPSDGGGGGGGISWVGPCRSRGGRS